MKHKYYIKTPQDRKACEKRNNREFVLSKWGKKKNRK